MSGKTTITPITPAMRNAALDRAIRRDSRYVRLTPGMRRFLGLEKRR